MKNKLVKTETYTRVILQLSNRDQLIPGAQTCSSTLRKTVKRLASCQIATMPGMDMRSRATAAITLMEGGSIHVTSSL